MSERDFPKRESGLPTMAGKSLRLRILPDKLLGLNTLAHYPAARVCQCNILRGTGGGGWVVSGDPPLIPCWDSQDRLRLCLDAFSGGSRHPPTIDQGETAEASNPASAGLG